MGAVRGDPERLVWAGGSVVELARRWWRRWTRLDDADLYPFSIEFPERVGRRATALWLALWFPALLGILVLVMMGLVSATVMSLTLLISGRRFQPQIAVARWIVAWATRLLFFATLLAAASGEKVVAWL